MRPPALGCGPSPSNDSSCLLRCLQKAKASRHRSHAAPHTRPRSAPCRGFKSVLQLPLGPMAENGPLQAHQLQ